MTSAPRTLTLTVGKLLQVAALVLFVIAALALFHVITGMTGDIELGLIATGLACQAAAALA